MMNWISRQLFSEIRFTNDATPKSGESAMEAEAFMDLAGLNALTAYQRCVIPTALAHRLGA